MERGDVAGTIHRDIPQELDRVAADEPIPTVVRLRILVVPVHAEACTLIPARSASRATVEIDENWLRHLRPPLHSRIETVAMCGYSLPSSLTAVISPHTGHSVSRLPVVQFIVCVM
jgi:hypothetical protein